MHRKENNFVSVERKERMKIREEKNKENKEKNIILSKE